MSDEAACPVDDAPVPRQPMGRPARFCSPACRAIDGQWSAMRRTVDGLRARARTSHDADDVRVLTARAAELEHGLAWQREAARNGWQSAHDYVDQLNAMVHAVADDD